MYAAIDTHKILSSSSWKLNNYYLDYCMVLFSFVFLIG